MKKLVITTACITLAGIFLILGLTYGAFFLFSPKTLARFYDRLGLYNGSLKLSVRCYEKSKTDEDLLDLCFVIDENRSSDIGKKYILILVENERFNDICNESPAQSQYYSLQEYFSGKLALCYLYSGDSTGAIDFSKAYVLKNGYASFNPFYTLLTNEMGLKKECVDDIKATLSELLDEFSDKERENLLSDLSLAQGL